MNRNSTIQLVLEHWQIKIVCLLLAICVYFLISFSSTGSRMVEIPLEVNLPTKYVAESLVPDSISIKIRGSEDIIYLIDPSLIVAHVDFSKVDNIGISKEPVVLNYDEKVFRKGNITVSTVPSDIRISFTEIINNE